MVHEKVVFRAGLTRVVLGALALWLLPAMYPGMAAFRWLFVVYIFLASVEQVLIWKNVGGMTRSFVAGLFDLAMITFLVHRVGSMHTPIVALYFLSGTMNALAVDRRIGLAQAVLGAAGYGGILLSARLGVLAYGPDSRVALPEPSATEALAAFTLVTLMLVVSALVVGLLVDEVRKREAELLRANAQLEALSQRDPLTQIFNRRCLLARLENELARVARGHPLAVVMIDLDGFKRVNDERGHLQGDLVLQELGAVLGRATRAVDTASRYGGDEFVVLLPDTTPESARAVAERLVAEIREVGTRFDAAHPVTASAGVAIARPGDTLAGVLRRADENAYRAKQSGGDRVVVAAA